MASLVTSLMTSYMCLQFLLTKQLQRVVFRQKTEICHKKNGFQYLDDFVGLSNTHLWPSGHYFFFLNFKRNFNINKYTYIGTLLKVSQIIKQKEKYIHIELKIKK